jgi:hypothetical protein
VLSESDDEHPVRVSAAAAVIAAINRNFLFMVAPLKWKVNTGKGY